MITVLDCVKLILSLVPCRKSTSNIFTQKRIFNCLQFRVAVLVSNHSAAAQMVQFSEPSVVIGTKAEGLPESAPQMVRAVAVDASHVSVSWLPGAFPRGPVLSYVLYLNELPAPSINHTAYSAVKVHTGQCDYRGVVSE